MDMPPPTLFGELRLLSNHSLLFGFFLIICWMLEHLKTPFSFILALMLTESLGILGTIYIVTWLIKVAQEINLWRTIPTKSFLAHVGVLCRYY
jgi:hypothetical protein